MKKNILFLSLLFSYNIYTSDASLLANAKLQLLQMYNEKCSIPTDIYEHIPVLRKLASECSTVIEIGLGGIISTWGIIQGLADNPTERRSYLGIDIVYPPAPQFTHVKSLAEANDISFEFWRANDVEIDIRPTEFLFIDSLHTYCHLMTELEKFSPKVTKYIALHDTSEPWGDRDDNEYHGNYSEYPAHFDRNKRGLWLAVEDFLKNHPEWTLLERRLNNHGFTILKRIKS